MKIIETLWFTPIGGAVIGIVVGEDEITKEVKAYIGTGYGFNENADAQNILKHGAKLHKPVLKAMLEVMESR